MYVCRAIINFLQVPRGDDTLPRGEDVVGRQNYEDQMDATDGSAAREGARVQHSHRLPQQAPSRPHDTARDTAQPRRRVLNAPHLQRHALPTPPLSRSNSTAENARNNDAQVNVVRRGDEHVSLFNSRQAMFNSILCRLILITMYWVAII